MIEAACFLIAHACIQLTEGEEVMLVKHTARAPDDCEVATPGWRGDVVSCAEHTKLYRRYSAHAAPTMGTLQEVASIQFRVAYFDDVVDDIGHDAHPGRTVGLGCGLSDLSPGPGVFG